MGWASKYIDDLKNGKVVKFRPRGNSMKGKIESGQLVTVSPLSNDPDVGDIVLCKVKGREYLHLVKSIKGNLFLIGNNKNHLNGWTARANVFGRVTKVEI